MQRRDSQAWVVTLATLTLFIIAMMAFMDIARQGVVNQHPLRHIESQGAEWTAVAVVADCEGDQDCFEKYGCGGYADPCEEEVSDDQN